MRPTLLELLSTLAASKGEAVALSARGHLLSYRMLSYSVRAAATYLRGNGLKPGDRVAILLPNGAEAVIARLAAMAAGGVAVPLPANTPPRQVAFVMCDSGARWLIVDGTRDDGPALAGCCERSTRLVWVGERHMTRGGTRVHWDDLLGTAPADKEVVLSPDSPALLQYVPAGRRLRGIVSTHQATGAGALLVADACALTHGQRVVQTASFATPFGGAMLNAGLAAGAMVMPRCEAGCAQYLLSGLETEQAEVLVTTTDAIDRILMRAVPANYDLSRLDHVFLAGRRAPKSGQCLAEKLPGSAISAVAVLAEAGGPVAMMRCGATGEMAGTPLPGIEMRVEPHTRAERDERHGELLIRGPGGMLSYWRSPDRNGDWVRTGIAAACDREGIVRLMDNEHCWDSGVRFLHRRKRYSPGADLDPAEMRPGIDDSVAGGLRAR